MHDCHAYEHARMLVTGPNVKISHVSTQNFTLQTFFTYRAITFASQNYEKIHNHNFRVAKSGANSMGCLLQAAITQLLMACFHESYRGHRPILDKECERHCLEIGLVLPGYGDEMAVFDPT